MYHIKRKVRMLVLLIPFVLIGCENINTAPKTNLNNTTKEIKPPIENNTQQSKGDYCSMTSIEMFDYLYSKSPFRMGNAGRVNFSKRFSYERNGWVESKITITGGLGSSSLEGDWEILGNNRIRVTNLIATNGRFDASRNGDASGILTINCEGYITGVLSDPNGNRQDVLIENRNN